MVLTPLRSEGLLTAPSSRSAPSLERVDPSTGNTPSPGTILALKRNKPLDGPAGDGKGAVTDQKGGKRFKAVPSGNFYGHSHVRKRGLTLENKENDFSPFATSADPRPWKRAKIDSPCGNLARSSQVGGGLDRPPVSEDNFMADLLDGLDGDSLFSPPGAPISPTRGATTWDLVHDDTSSSPTGETHRANQRFRTPSKRPRTARPLSERRNRTRSYTSPSKPDEGRLEGSVLVKREPLLLPFPDRLDNTSPATPLVPRPNAIASITSFIHTDSLKRESFHVKLEPPSLPEMSSNRPDGITCGTRNRIPKMEDIDALMAGLEDEFGIESWDAEMNDGLAGRLDGLGGAKSEDGNGSSAGQSRADEVKLEDSEVPSLDKVKVSVKVESPRVPRVKRGASTGLETLSSEPGISPDRNKASPPVTPLKSVHARILDDPTRSPELFDEFPFDEDFGLDTLSPSKPFVPSSPQEPSAYPLPHPLIHPSEGLQSGEGVGTSWARCGVTDVQVTPDAEEDGDGSRFGWGEKVVLVKETRGKRALRLLLKDQYASLVISIGDIINVITPTLDVSPTATPVTSSAPSTSCGLPAHPSTSAGSPLTEVVLSLRTPENHIVLHPDILVPMTTLAGSSSCLRKGVLQGMVKSGGGATTKPLLYGNIIHEILQTALQSRCFTSTALRKTLADLLLRSDIQLSLWAADLGHEEVRQEVWEKVEQALLTFGNKWIGAQPGEEAIMHNSQKRLSLVGLHEVEESIWSIKWGLKGKVDASVQAVVEEERRKGQGRPRGASRESPMPFEIKTGRAIGVMDHRAQTMLYTLLMAERYHAGLLYYTQTDSMLQVPAAKGELRSLLHTRNELAGFLARQRVTRQKAMNASQARRTQSSQIVTPVKEPPKPATQCSPGTTRASPKGSQVVAEDLPFLPATIDEPRTCRSCYSADSCMLYRKTVDAVEPNEEDPIADLYRERTGHLGNDDQSFFSRWENLISIEEQDIIRFKNQLWTMTAAEREKSGRCFAAMTLLHDSVRLLNVSGKADVYKYTFVRDASDGVPAHPSFLSGHIGKGDPVSLSIEPDLLSIARAFVFELSPSEVTLVTDMKLDFKALLTRAGRPDCAIPMFRVDKDEMLSGTARMRNNLAQLFYSADTGGDEKRRRLVVHLEPPVFDETYAPGNQEVPANLNVDQANAMRKVLTARDYALILGMPGTGKTTTIAEIITALVARGKSVLLTSYTHSAVDTILMKLLNTEQKILRIGNIDKIHPDVAHLALERMGQATSLSQLDDRLMSPQIVATTCLSIDHPIFSRRKFDYCIVDEASQITLPTCIGPLRLADTFVLVGDHFQLPPIVKNSEARRGGLDVSLFRLLSDSHPEAVVDLSYQYRMNADIMMISNKLIYGDRLKCGSEAVCEQRLELPKDVAEVLADDHGCKSVSCWMKAVLDPGVKAVFVDTDAVPARDSRIGDLVQNEVEGKLILQTASCLVKCGIHEEDVAVITPYRQQIKLLTRLLSDMGRIEVMTADKSQGRDKDCILISMVRSNDAGNIGELLRDWRRINVSFTRAKKKLIIFGSRHTLQSDRLLCDFFALMEENKWIYKLAPFADKAHEDAFPIPAIARVQEPKLQPGSQQRKLGAILINSRPVLRDIFNDITNTCDMRV